MTRVAIVGAGAMGSVYGALLQEGGLDVSMVDVSPALLDAARRQQGIQVERDGQTRLVPLAVTDDPASVGVVDVVLFFVKCYHTAAAAEAARPMVGEHTVVASLQNGWGNGDVLVAAFDPARVAVGVSYHSATVREPGLVSHTAAGATMVGPYQPAAADAARRFGAVLTAAGLEVSVTDTVLDEIWKKLTLNTATLPTSALTGYTAGALGKDADALALVDGLATETVAVARALGRDVDLAERLAAIRGALDRAGDGKASMLQDVEGGRRTEVDVVNGAVVREAARFDIDVPLNQAMVALVHGYESAHRS